MVPNFKMLLVDDDPETHELVEGILREKNVAVLSAFDCERAVELVLQDPPDIILLDYASSGISGLNALLKVRPAEDLNLIPVVVMTQTDNHNILSACFRVGATDCIRKPICGPELIVRVASVLHRSSADREIAASTQRDSLTGLCNRTVIADKIQSAIDRKTDREFAVLFIDIDRFKIFNDCLGFAAGDQLLKQIADRLSKVLQSKDPNDDFLAKSTTARLCGDEFAILLEDLTDPEDALLVACRLLQRLEDPYAIDGEQFGCSASIGVVNDARDYLTSNDVLRDADTAMHEAKSAGRGRYVTFHRSMQTRVEQRLRIDSDLRFAVANDELFLEYQPIVSLETGTTVAFEALVRWNHPQRGMIMPSVFLPSAEESGLIVPIGEWVLYRACQEFASWRDTLGSDAPSHIHVNVARKQLHNNLVETVSDALEKHSIDPECLHLEITESEIMQFPEIAKATLAALRKLGVKIEMDDFGTGHSSMACLLDLPVDVLKIDQSFIANMSRNRSFTAMVHAVIDLAQNLNLQIVAEGIETEDQLLMLQSMNCDFGQGYYFDRPMRGDAVKSYLRRANPACCSQSVNAPHETAQKIARSNVSFDLICH